MLRWRGGEANGFGFSKLQVVSCFWTISPDAPRPPNRAPRCAALKRPGAAGSGAHAVSKDSHHATGGPGKGPLPGPRHRGRLGLRAQGCPYLVCALSAHTRIVVNQARGPRVRFFLGSCDPQALVQLGSRRQGLPPAPLTGPATPLPRGAPPWSRP
jgi:hypothetical protein